MTWFEAAVLNGGIMMIFLIPCSVIALGFIVQGLISLRRERLAPRALIALARSARGADDVAAARRRIADDPSPLGQIIAGLANVAFRDTQELEREIDRLAGEQSVLIYHRRIAPLALLRNVSLYLGLLGTILGIMKSFGEFALGAEQSVEVLGQGINQALVTTAWGLSIAIPCMAFVFVFRQRLIAYERVVLPAAAQQAHMSLTRKA